jgi:hypothetical protein
VIELSPTRQALLANVVDVQERMLDGVTEVFRGLSHHHDAGVSSVCEEVLGLIKNNRDVIEAMIDGLNETKH